MTVYGDTYQIQQLLCNLLDNALKFHKDGVSPEITVQSKKAGEAMVLIEIQDNGIGMRRTSRKCLLNAVYTSSSHAIWR